MGSRSKRKPRREDRVYRRRTGERLTYQTLGERTGLARSTLESIATRSDYNASISTIDKICRALGCAPGELLKSHDTEISKISRPSGRMVDALALPLGGRQTILGDSYMRVSCSGSLSKRKPLSPMCGLPWSHQMIKGNHLAPAIGSDHADQKLCRQ